MAAQAQGGAAVVPGPPASKPWSIGVYAAGGFASAYRYEVHFTNPIPAAYSAPIDLQLYNAGIQVGKVTGGSVGPSFLRGQLELDANLLPYWQGRYPRQTLKFRIGNQGGTADSARLPPENRFGASITPFLCRWNFSGWGRFVPWGQLGGGLLWTNHKFPQYPVRTADTSVINFTPQFGFGMNYFRKPNQSLFFAVNEVHISNASLGDQNPGVNITTQFSAGYSWWWK